jgi:DNA-binding transcriptional ArsR family regulator
VSFWVVGVVWKNSDVLEDQHELLIMLALASYAHDDGSNVFPMVETLAQKCKMSDRQARYVLKRLRERGLIERVERLYRGPWKYRMCLDALEGKTAQPACLPEEVKLHAVHPRGAGGAVLPERHLLNESVNETVILSAPPAAKRVEYTKVFEAWWDVYGKRGSKMEAFREWNKLGAEDRAAAVAGAPAYLASTNYAVEGRRYLHGRWWEKEVPSPNGKHEASEEEKSALRERIMKARDGEL